MLMYRKCCKRLFTYLCVIYISWIVFLKYTCHSSGHISFPMDWKLKHNCDPFDTDVRRWGKYLQNLTKRQQYPLYNTSRKVCLDEFYHDFEANMRRILNYKIVQNAPCYDKIETSISNHENDSSVNIAHFPVIVTAGSSNHFYETQALLKSIHTVLVPLYKNVKVIFYDIGLKESEHLAMKTHCKCEVRKFPFHQFMPHVRLLEAYAWKPLIMFEVLKEYNFVMWLDACIRFRHFGIKSELDNIFQRTKVVGIQLQKSPRWIVSDHTKPDTFTILGEKECLFDYPELESGWIVIYKNSMTVNTIIRPWVGCALTEHCMTHPYPSFLHFCSRDIWKFLLWTKCHRFDQSVLNIILIRLFNRHRKLIEFDGSHIADIFRGNKEKYFPE